MIGTNAKRFDFHISSNSSAQLYGTSSRIQLKDMVMEATAKILHYLKIQPKVSFLDPPTVKIGEGLSNETHLPYDILTMMLENENY